MDIKDIQELIKFVAKSGATEVDLEIDNVKISIKSPAMKAGKVIEPIIGSAQETVMTTPAHQPILKTEANQYKYGENHLIQYLWEAGSQVGITFEIPEQQLQKKQQTGNMFIMGVHINMEVMNNK